MTFLAVLLTMGCSQRYAFRSKVFVFKKQTIPISIQINNESPVIFSKSFEAQIRKTCEKKLMTRGFGPPKKKQTPLYHFELSLQVDSFIVPHAFRTSAYPNPKMVDGGLVNVKAIVLEANFTHIKNKSVIWKDEYDLYFFNQEKKDLRRTKGVCKYLIKQIKPMDN